MKPTRMTVAALMSVVVLAGCDILELDNYDEPTSTLSGTLVLEGQPVGLRQGGVQLELWQPGYELNQKVPVLVHNDGSFAAMVFDGTYKLNLLANNGPWVNSSDTTYVELRGKAEVTVPVTPYYTIRNARVVHNTSVNAPNGAIDATFNVGMINTSRPLEFVGVYVGTTVFVDRINSLPIPNAQRERLQTAILPQLNSHGDITIRVNLPADIYETKSPVRRSHVFVRVGVKTLGVAEMLFTQLHEIAI